jgi:hypothetical protein
MSTLRLTTGLTAALLLATLLPALPVPAQNKPGGVTLRTVKYAGLAEEVVKNRGKVVVVDLWGFF